MYRYSPQWEFGRGLSYSNFTYFNLQLSHTRLVVGETQRVTVAVHNLGPMAGAHTVLVFVRCWVRSVTPEMKLLKAFDKIFLQAGQRADLEFTLGPESFTYTDENLATATAQGNHSVYVGESRQDFFIVDEQA
mmetsp:Transcript_53433/g.125669  ORF Transcript_53433/g.125669 Transcript_53433/m.125669 type:complete len:133 (+) Transcript_53433:154-552(+)